MSVFIFELNVNLPFFLLVCLCWSSHSLPRRQLCSFCLLSEIREQKGEEGGEGEQGAGGGGGVVSRGRCQDFLRGLPV